MNREQSHIYPTIPGETSRIRQYRARCQKTREHEEIWSWFVLRRISIYVTLVLRRLNVSPNAVSWASVVLLLIAGGLMTVARPWAYVLAVLAYNFGYLCDCVDGEIARLNGQTSNKGFFIDTLIRATSVPLIVSIGIAFIGDQFSIVMRWLLYMISVVGTFALLVPLAYHLTHRSSEMTDPVSEMRTTSHWHEWFAFLVGLPGYFAFLLLAIIVERLSGYTVTFYVHSVFLCVTTLKTILRLYVTYRRII